MMMELIVNVSHASRHAKLATKMMETLANLVSILLTILIVIIRIIAKRVLLLAKHAMKMMEISVFPVLVQNITSIQVMEIIVKVVLSHVIHVT